MRNHRPLLVALVILSASACDRATIVQPEERTPVNISSRGVIGGSTRIDVADVEQFYSAVNDPMNAGATIVLAPGTYVLSPTSGGVPRPNGGRLDLQPGMSLTGLAGDRSAVVIDMSSLPLSSLTVALGRTGGIRIGRGHNSVEWLTILGNGSATASIETDLADGSPTEVTVSHVLAHGSLRGIDVRNTGASMAGRKIVGHFTDNEFHGGNEGIRLVNLAGANGSEIDLTMSGNYVHDNADGCVIESNRSSATRIHVRSSGDRFEHNALGCLIGGGLVAAPGAANSNSTTFEGYGDAFVDNTLDVPAIDYGGVLVVGAETPVVANSASQNTVTVALWGTRVSGNQNVDFQAYAARSIADPPGIAGTGNHVTIELHGVSKQIDVDAINSLPSDPSMSNIITVVR